MQIFHPLTPFLFQNFNLCVGRCVCALHVFQKFGSIFSWLVNFHWMTPLFGVVHTKRGDFFFFFFWPLTQWPFFYKSNTKCHLFLFVGTYPSLLYFSAPYHRVYSKSPIMSHISLKNSIGKVVCRIFAKLDAKQKSIIWLPFWNCKLFFGLFECFFWCINE